MDQASTQQLQPLLNELLEVLLQERAALRSLDKSGIELATQQKQSLDDAIHRARAGEPMGPALRALAERIRKEAEHNRMLLVHARSCVQGVLETLTGQSLQKSDLGPRNAVAPKPLALNIRG